MKYSKYNVVIIGSGLAGLYLANKLSSQKFQEGVVLITKENLFSGSTSLAQGGIVGVMPKINPLDSIESHIKDTLTAGCGLNNINTIEFVSKNSSQCSSPSPNTPDLFGTTNRYAFLSPNKTSISASIAFTSPQHLHFSPQAQSPLSAMMASLLATPQTEKRNPFYSAFSK